MPCERRPEQSLLLGVVNDHDLEVGPVIVPGHLKKRVDHVPELFWIVERRDENGEERFSAGGEGGHDSNPSLDFSLLHSPLTSYSFSTCGFAFRYVSSVIHSDPFRCPILAEESQNTLAPATSTALRQNHTSSPVPRVPSSLNVKNHGFGIFLRTSTLMH